MDSEAERDRTRGQSRRPAIACSSCATPSHAAQAGPGAALELLRKVRDYREQKLAVGEEGEVTPLFVEKVFAIHSGLPLFVVSRSAGKPAAQIRDWFRERIIGQEAAIEAVVEMIAFYKARLHDTGKPVGSFLFVGPTGVGKTEMARALAEFFFGSDRRMLRFDMSEFTDFHSFEMLVGSAQASPERPARLIDPVRIQPFQVLLFDELEKAHRNIQDLFLQLLDEGRLTTPKGETVSFRNTIIVATSNVGAFEGMTTAIGFGGKNDGYDADKAMSAIEAHFRPEFLNRFQHVVLFHPLTQEQAAKIARADLQATLRREGITGRNLIVDVHDDVIDHVLAVGFNPRYGGRGIKRELRRQVILPIATLLMERAPEPGSLIDVGVQDGRVRVRVVDTPDSLHAKAEKAPIRTRSGDRLTRPEIVERIAIAQGIANRSRATPISRACAHHRGDRRHPHSSRRSGTIPTVPPASWRSTHARLKPWRGSSGCRTARKAWRARSNPPPRARTWRGCPTVCCRSRPQSRRPGAKSSPWDRTATGTRWSRSHRSAPPHRRAICCSSCTTTGRGTGAWTP